MVQTVPYPLHTIYACEGIANHDPRFPSKLQHSCIYIHNDCLTRIYSVYTNSLHPNYPFINRP
jgi:hypothetical protein